MSVRARTPYPSLFTMIMADLAVHVVPVHAEQSGTVVASRE